MAQLFETKIRYDKIQENGAVKKVTEAYLVDALSFTEAEARIIEEMTPYISGDFSVAAIKRTKIAEIFFTSDVALAIGKYNSDIEKALVRKDAKLLDKATSGDELIKAVNNTDSRWYLFTVSFITLDEKSGKEKKSSTQILVESSDITAAKERFNEGMRGTMADYEIAGINETNYLEVFKYSDKEK